jgi:nitrogen regulatory protein P-II 1
MKKIEAVIKPANLNEVKDSLNKIGIKGMTFTEVKFHGAGGWAALRLFTTMEHCLDFIPTLKIEIIVPDNIAAKAIEIITKNAKTNTAGDGKVFVSHVEEAMRIRTGEKGEGAIQ